MKKSIFLSLLLVPFFALANGGPVDGSSIHSTGDLRFMNVPDVDLVSEKLHIKIEGDYSEVLVEYVLKSNSKYNQNVEYAFPIEFLRDDMSGMFELFDENILDVEFELDGKWLEVESQTDFSTQFDDKLKDYEDKPLQKKTHWHFTQFGIDKHHQVTLSVSYKVKNNLSDWSTSKEFFGGFSDRTLYYNFSPAHHWGNGRVSQILVTVDASSLHAEGAKLEISGLPFLKNDGIYTYLGAYFDLKNAKPLLIKYDNSGPKMAKMVTSISLQKESLISATASSSLQGNYQPENVFDKDFSTAWVEGKSGPGIGESITLNFKTTALGAIVIVNGYLKSEATYQENNRIKKAKLEIENAYYADDEMQGTIIEFEDRPYQEVNLQNFFSVSGYAEYGDYGTPTGKLKLTILEVYPGSKYDDTCISEIFIAGALRD